MDNPTTKVEHFVSIFYGEMTNRTLFLHISSDNVNTVSNTCAFWGV